MSLQFDCSRYFIMIGYINHLFLLSYIILSEKSSLSCGTRQFTSWLQWKENDSRSLSIV